MQKYLSMLTFFVPVPPYECVHTVTPAPWSYPEDIVSMVIGEHAGHHDNERIIDLSRRPPEYEGNKEFISKLKHDLGIKVSVVTKAMNFSFSMKCFISLFLLGDIKFQKIFP